MRALKARMQSMQRSEECLQLEEAKVVRVLPVGMGDRVCVDLCANMAPGEGMLVGNFCRTLFLVHSEVRCYMPVLWGCPPSHPVLDNSAGFFYLIPDK